MLLNPRLFVLPPDEISQVGLQNLTYGTLTNKGLQTMKQSLKHYGPKQIYGLDLGCGDGELIYHLEQGLQGSRWEGVEISEMRVEAATRPVTIWTGDMLTENFRPYNVLHADNLCLEDVIADQLEEKIVREFTGLYLTYRTPQNLRFLRRAKYIATIETETSWAKHPILFYSI